MGAASAARAAPVAAAASARRVQRRLRRRRRPRRPPRQPVRPGRAAARRGSRGSGPQRGADLETELHLDVRRRRPGRHHALHLTATRPADLPRHGRQARHHARTSARSCGGRGVLDDNQGLFSFSQPCPHCARPRHASSTTRARPARHAASSAGRARSRCASPPGVTDGQRIRLKGRGEPGRNGGPPATSTSRCTCAPHPLFGRDGAQPHAHRAGHLPRGRARRRRSRCPTLDGDPVTCGSRRARRTGRTLPGQGPGVADAARAPATCWSPSRWPCPPKLSSGRAQGASRRWPRPTDAVPERASTPAGRRTRRLRSA